MTDTATRELTWPARTGNLPVSGLPPEQALSFFQWAGQNAGQMLNVEHDRGNVTDDVFAASGDDPLTWWQTTPLFDALRAQAGLVPPAEPDPELTSELQQATNRLAFLTADHDNQAALINRLTGQLDEVRENAARTEDQTAIIIRLTAELAEARQAASNPDSLAALAEARQQVADLAARADQAEQALQAERDRAADTSGADGLATELAVARRQVDELAANLHNERTRVQTVEAELADATRNAAAIVPYDDTEVIELRQQIAGSQHELDQANLHNDRLAEQISMFEADQARHQSVRGLTRIVNIGTGVVMVSVAVLVYVGGVAAAQKYAGWSLTLALLVPLAIEAGAAVEIAGIVRDRRLGHTPHWAAWVLTVGLLGSSIVGMILHATNAPTGSHHWWGYWLASWLPIELAMLVRSALGGDKHRQTGTR